MFLKRTLTIITNIESTPDVLVVQRYLATSLKPKHHFVWSCTHHSPSTLRIHECSTAWVPLHPRMALEDQAYTCLKVQYAQAHSM